jgi:hypothetical protein
VFRPQKTLKKNKTKIIQDTSLPALLYSRENWTIKAKDGRRIIAAQMKHMRKNSRIRLNGL